VICGSSEKVNFIFELNTLVVNLRSIYS